MCIHEHLAIMLKIFLDLLLHLTIKKKRIQVFIVVIYASVLPMFILLDHPVLGWHIL